MHETAAISAFRHVSAPESKHLKLKDAFMMSSKIITSIYMKYPESIKKGCGGC
jgi:hypothetical protein